nr:MAG TPA: hypothetical protein [Caudoviricetes sp.]
MKNKEKYAKEIVDIACKGHDFMVDKNTNEVADCCDVVCATCLFIENCEKVRREWAESEYIEKPVISKRDRAFLEYLNANIHYIARDKDGGLYVYISKPFKIIDCWESSGCEINENLRIIDIDFPMVKWEDDEPWLIEDLKKLEVVDSYE